jgi:hypothetical protein
MEDVDFREQLKGREIKFLFVPKASVVHPWRPLAPDDKFLKTLLISHAIFLDRYPLRRPSFYGTCRDILKEWVFDLFMEAPRLKFRGFWRYFARQSTATLLQFLIWSGFNRRHPGR